jgi:hypothetical protein
MEIFMYIHKGLRRIGPFLACAIAFPGLLLAADLQIIALGGAQAPGMPEGTNFNASGFDKPAVNAQGQVAFKSVVQPSLDTIYFGFPDSLQPIAMEGEVAPGSDGQIFCNLDFSNPSPVLIPADNGTLAFSGLVKQPEALSCTTSVPGVGIWLWADDQLTLVALEGQQAADADAGLIYSDIYPVFRYGNQGVLFRATLHNPDTQTNSGIGLWGGLPGSLQLLALTGEAAAGQAGKNYEGFAASMFTNNTGQSSFWAWLQVNGSDRAIYLGDAASLDIPWKEGADASDFAPGYFFTGPANNQPDEWGLNDSSKLCLSSEVDHNDLQGEDTLWRHDGGQREVIASESGSDPMTGEGYRFTNLRSCWINSAGKILFEGRVNTEPTTTRLSGLWTASGSGESLQLELVTSQNDILFSDETAYPVTSRMEPNEPHINELGHVVFEVNVTDNASEPVQDRNSIWLSEGSSEKLIAINGQMVDQGGGVMLELSDLDLGDSQDGSGNQDGKPSALGDNDQVIFTGRLGGRGYAVLYYSGRGDIIFKDSFEDL